jgi:PAS domain S-box-containing protein
MRKQKERTDQIKPVGRKMADGDLSKKTKTEEALRQSEERYRTMIMSVGDGVIATDTEGQVELLNPVAEALTGWRQEEARGKPLEEIFRIINEETRQTVENPVRRAMREGLVVGLVNHSVLIAKDGSEHPIADSGAPIRNEKGEITGVVLVFRDQTKERAAHFLLMVEESTERKRMEEALATERRFLRQVIDTVPAFICVKTEAGPYALANESLAKAYGTAVSAVEGKSDLDFSPTPEEAAAFRKDDLEVIHGQRTKTIAEEPITYADGTVHWYSTTKIPIIDPDGSCSKALVVAMDITELREHREHLQELVERRTAELTASQAALIEAQSVAHSGSWEWNAVRDEITGSEEFYRLFDVAPEGIARFSQFVERLHPEDRERVLRDVADALQQDRPYDTDYRVKLGDDGWRNINARGRAFTDTAGKAVSLVGTCLDITERKRGEEALRESEEYAIQIIESSHDCIKVLDLEGHLLSMSPGGQILLEIDDITTYLNTLWVDFWKGADREGAVEAIAKASQGATGIFTGYCETAKGTPKWWEVLVTPIKDADGTIERLLAVSRDITERKRAEEEVRRLNVELEQRVHTRTAELQVANEELEAFTYSVSHDLRTPLRAMDGFSRILLDEHASHLPPEVQRYLNLVRSNTLQMAHLVDDLLTLSRLGRQSVIQEQVNPAALLRDALDLLRNEQDGRHVKITVGDLPTCQGDRALLKQVFVNLLSNALKFTRPRDPAIIEVGSSRKDGENVFFVRDNGVGFDMRYVGKLFGVFQRLHRSEDYEGTGVGLAIVQRIVHRHGGRVWAEAEPDKGATFYFTLGGTYS